MDNEPTLTIDNSGNKKWKLNGNHHRVDGPAIEWANGDKEWCLNGAWHREDGPAIERANGYKEWCLNGAWHREDGPAIEWANGSESWWLNGKHYFFDRWLEANTYISEEEKVMMKLIYG
jgi:hypothetical protein